MGPGHPAMAVVGRNAYPGVGLTRNDGDTVAGVGRPNDDTVDIHRRPAMAVVGRPPSGKWGQVGGHRVAGAVRCEWLGWPAVSAGQAEVR